MAWIVQLSRAAEDDLQHIIDWTRGRFGDRQARSYAENVVSTVLALADGPTQPGVRARDDIEGGLFTLHIARAGRKGRHFVLFRVDRKAKDPTIDVLRLLHDSMDLARHTPSEGE